MGAFHVFYIVQMVPYRAHVTNILEETEQGYVEIILQSTL